MADLEPTLKQIVATISLALLLSALNLSKSGGVGAEDVKPKTDAVNNGQRRVLDDDDWRDTWESLTSNSAPMNDEVVLQKLTELKQVFGRFAVLPYDHGVRDQINRIIELGQMRPESCTKSNIDLFASWLPGKGKATGPIPSYTTPLAKKFLSMCTDALLDEVNEKMRDVKVDIRPLCDRLERVWKKFRPNPMTVQKYFENLFPRTVRFMISELDKTYSVPDQKVSPNGLFDEYIIESCKDYQSVYSRLDQVKETLRPHARPERSHEYYMVLEVNLMCNFIYQWRSAFEENMDREFLPAKKALDEYMKNPPILDVNPTEEAEKVESDDESDESSLGPVPGQSQLPDADGNIITGLFSQKPRQISQVDSQTAETDLPSE